MFEITITAYGEVSSEIFHGSRKEAELYAQELVAPIEWDHFNTEGIDPEVTIREVHESVHDGIAVPALTVAVLAVFVVGGFWMDLPMVVLSAAFPYVVSFRSVRGFWGRLWGVLRESFGPCVRRRVGSFGRYNFGATRPIEELSRSGREDDTSFYVLTSAACKYDLDAMETVWVIPDGRELYFFRSKPQSFSFPIDRSLDSNLIGYIDLDGEGAWTGLRPFYKRLAKFLDGTDEIAAAIRVSHYILNAIAFVTHHENRIWDEQFEVPMDRYDGEACERVYNTLYLETLKYPISPVENWLNDCVLKAA